MWSSLSCNTAFNDESYHNPQKALPTVFKACVIIVTATLDLDGRISVIFGRDALPDKSVVSAVPILNESLI